MPWQSQDLMALPESNGKVYEKADVMLDGISFQNCTFRDCRLIYKGGPARMISCYIAPGVQWMLVESAAFVLQFLQDAGWTIAPPGSVEPLQNQKPS